MCPVTQQRKEELLALGITLKYNKEKNAGKKT